MAAKSASLATTWLLIVVWLASKLSLAISAALEGVKSGVLDGNVTSD